MDIKVISGNILREARNEKGLSQEKLAFDADLDRSYISKLETAVYQPSISTLIAIAKVLNVRPGELLDKIADEFDKN